MNPTRAKRILALYRPGTADVRDPDFAEALRLVDADPELRRWFDAHCETYAAFQAKFKQIRPPEGLMEQILAERKIHTLGLARRRAVLVAALAAVAVLAGSISYWISAPPRPGVEASGFSAYRLRMTSAARRSYAMALETDNLDRIRSFFEEREVPADYRLPAALRQNARATGCALLAWEGKPVAMICFKTGRPLPPGQSSDIWVLVVDRGSMRDAPSGNLPALVEVNGAATASWTAGDKLYLVIVEGNEDLLRQYL
jgi:hypothetical protein